MTGPIFTERLEAFRVLPWIMDLAVEFLHIPGVLSLRLYSPFKRTDRRPAVQCVVAHGCYRPCIPILLDGTEIGSALIADVRALGVSLTRAVPDSPIATLVNPVGRAPDGTAGTHEADFTTPGDALRWLSAEQGRLKRAGATDARAPRAEDQT